MIFSLARKGEHGCVVVVALRFPGYEDAVTNILFSQVARTRERARAVRRPPIYSQEPLPRMRMRDCATREPLELLQLFACAYVLFPAHLFANCSLRRGRFTASLGMAEKKFCKRVYSLLLFFLFFGIVYVLLFNHK